jgi:hypothetical protein
MYAVSSIAVGWLSLQVPGGRQAGGGRGQQEGGRHEARGSLRGSAAQAASSTNGADVPAGAEGVVAAECYKITPVSYPAYIHPATAITTMIRSCC